MPANDGKETLRDAVADIKASRESAKVRVRQAIWRRVKSHHYGDELGELLRAESDHLKDENARR